MMLMTSLLLLVPTLVSTQAKADPSDKELQFKIAKTLVQVWPVLPFKQGAIHYRIYRSENQTLVTVTSDAHPDTYVFFDAPQSKFLKLNFSIPSKLLASELLLNGITYHLASSWSGQSPIFD